MIILDTDLTYQYSDKSVFLGVVAVFISMIAIAGSAMCLCIIVVIIGCCYLKRYV